MMIGTPAGPSATDAPSEAKMKSILDPSFRYTSSMHTDVRKTFQRIRRELQRDSDAKPVVRGDAGANVLVMPRRIAGPH